MITDLHTSIKNQELAHQDLSCLYEITKILAAGTDLQESLNRVVRVLADMKEMENGTVTIVNPLTRELEIEVACGITATAQKKESTSWGGDYRSGCFHRRTGYCSPDQGRTALSQQNRHSE